MEVDEKEVEGKEATAAATKAAAKKVEEGREEENGAGDDDDDRERLTEALECLGLVASLSSPSLALVAESSEGMEGAAFVDVCSFEGLLGSAFAGEALRATAAVVAANSSVLPWVALVLVGFPDSPLSWTEAAAAKEERERAKKKTTTAAAKTTTTTAAAKTTTAAKTPEPAVRLGPEACREHALFVVVVKGKDEGSPPRFLAAVASGGGDGFAPSRLL